MAGIGFELRRMIDSGQGLVAKIRGYTCAGLISSGPWIMTILTLGVLSAFARLIAVRVEFEIFRGLITYAFAFSLIVVGLLQMSVTRRVADLLYQKKYDRVLPGFNACGVNFIETSSAATTVTKQLSIAESSTPSLTIRSIT